MSAGGPIGLFDSGVGGLTVVARILEELPEESIIYFGDTAHVPYGPRPLEEVRDYALRISRFLVREGAKAIVIACNTSTSASLEIAQAELPVPVLGTVEHGVRAALAVARNGCVGVLATEATVQSGAYERAFHRERADLKVVQQTCPEFVPLVEAGAASSPAADAAAERYVGPMSARGIDTIVLGCTHYPFLSDAIRRVVGPEVSLVDPAEEMVRALTQVLEERGLRRHSDEPPTHRYLVSGDPAPFVDSVRRVLGREIAAERVDIFHGED